jgi:outer membrane protein assembly factor BamB
MYHQSYAFEADVPVPRAGAAPAELWRVENGIGYDISPTAIEEIDGQVITGTDKGNLAALDAATGAPLWYHKLSIALVNPVTAWESADKICILASTMDGVYSLLEIEK